MVLSYKDYPRCPEKMQWLRDNWQSHPCYAENGVNSSESTIYRYLSEVERHCPAVEHGTTLAPTAPVAEIHELTKEEIFGVMTDSQVNYAFIKSRIERLLPNAIKEAAMDGPCPDSKRRQFDLIFTDIMGLRLIKRRLKALFLTQSCVIRLLDSFGTHAEFNHAAYFSKNREKLGGNKKNYWGGNNLRLKQFLTMYPHTDDNTFLGFVVELHEGHAEPLENITLVYGKEAYMWKGADEVIRAAAEFGEVHATVGDMNDDIRALNVVNHGVLKGREFHALLQKSRVFLGLGFPYEGPAPLEAVANGAVFINPMVIPPISRRSYKFFEEKPTLRELRSQNPYMERFVGPPYALTVDVRNKTELREALQSAFNSTVGYAHP
ncbi:GLY-2 protein [Aphelenchoides avenae]|nr:GLY-2 protein [Aphelenchus avenae]